MAKAVIRKPKKKVCQFCKEKATGVDYKDTTLLRKFISDRGKIRARRVTGNCRSEEHTSELQSLMRISYAVFCLKKTTRKLVIISLQTITDSNKDHSTYYFPHI